MTSDQDSFGGNAGLSEAGLAEAGLSESEERLLLQYCDGECSWWRARSARALLKRSANARTFFAELKAEGVLLREYFSVTERDWKCPEAELENSCWSKVLARIRQEQRAELLSGERKLSRLGRASASPSSILSFFPDRELLARIQWGISGAAVAVLVGFVVGPSGGNNSQGLVASSRTGHGENRVAQIATRVGEHPYIVERVPSVDNVSLGRGEEFPPVDLDGDRVGPNDGDELANVIARSGGAQSAPLLMAHSRLVAGQIPRTLEVDWMRSRGRVRLLHDPSEHAPIIWVNGIRPSANSLEERQAPVNVKFSDASARSSLASSAVASDASGFDSPFTSNY